MLTTAEGWTNAVRLPDSPHVASRFDSERSQAADATRDKRVLGGIRGSRCDGAMQTAGSERLRQRRRIVQPIAAALALALGTADACAQATVDFRAKDGSRFVLAPTPGAPIVHWAIATPIGVAVDPADAPGLAEAAALASMRGTWNFGSLDVARERQALTELDAIEAELRGAPKAASAELDAKRARANELRTLATSLCDAAAFRRVLAAAPAAGVQLRFTATTSILSLRTTPLALPQVAKLLVDRRERQSLRGVEAELESVQRRAVAAWDADPLSPLRAEAIALAFAGHPLARAGERPTPAPTRRDTALATWALSQHPQNSVHVLTGSFDAAAVRADLERTFERTLMPAAQPRQPAVPRAIAATRRAAVPGARFPAVLVAFPLPPEIDRDAAATAARWFADGPESWLGKELVRSGRATARVAARAPWPEGAAAGLLVVEVTDAAGTREGLTEETLALIAAGRSAAPEPGQLPLRFAAQQRAFELATDGPTGFAAWCAERLLATDAIAIPAAPAAPVYPELAERLRGILASNPIVVEWSKQ